MITLIPFVFLETCNNLTILHSVNASNKVGQKNILFHYDMPFYVCLFKISNHAI